MISELKAADITEYKAAILGFANCLILGTEEIWMRHSIRSEMIGLGFLETIENMKLEENPDLLIQVQVFEHHRSKDEDLLDLAEEKPLFDLFSIYFLKVNLVSIITNYASVINKNSVFLKKIKDKPQALTFHSMLTKLIRLDVSDQVKYGIDYLFYLDFTVINVRFVSIVVVYGIY